MGSGERLLVRNLISYRKESRQ